ncbi:MAG TPA: M50 family metallopeptidase [Nitrososphaeraceae archaeon]
MLHTPFGLKFFDYVAKTRAARAYARANTYLMPIITVAMILIVVTGLVATISNVSVRETAREIGPLGNLLIPGLNPYLPISYTLIALIISVFIHEAGHGIVARVYGIKVESTGIAFVLFVPVGAFVNLEKDGMEKATVKQKSAILTAGPLNNIILATISIALLFGVVSTLNPIATQDIPKNGLEITSVTKGSLAEKIGLSDGSTILSIGQTEIRDQPGLSQALRSSIGGQTQILWQDKEGNQLTKILSIPADTDPSKPILGVMAVPNVDPTLALDSYEKLFIFDINEPKNILFLLTPPTLQPGVPFSDLMAPKYESTIFGSSFPIFANTLFWLWFINLNLGLFNALPIAILDGGQLYGTLIESRSKIDKNRLRQISSAVSTIMIFIVAIWLLMPYVL